MTRKRILPLLASAIAALSATDVRIAGHVPVTTARRASSQPPVEGRYTSIVGLE